MPWWGWLITFGIVMVCATAVIVVTIMTRAMRDLAQQDMHAEHERWRQKNERLRR